MRGRAGGLDAAALIHGHVDDDGAVLHPPQVVVSHELRRLPAGDEHGADHDIRAFDPLQDRVAVRVERIHVGRHDVRQIPEAREIDVEDRDVGAETRRDGRSVRADDSAPEDDDFRRKDARHAAEKDPVPTRDPLQVPGRLLDRHASRHFGHGREERKFARR